MEELLSWRRLFGGFFRRLQGSWLACWLLSLLAFLPLAGLTLLSPGGSGDHEWSEFARNALLLCRFLTPMSACLVVLYLARQESKLSPQTSLKRALALTPAAIGLVMAVWVFSAIASLFFLLPGLGFLLASSIALPVLIVEGTSVPEAVRRSWERTRHVRDSLLLFWSVFFTLGVGLLGLVTVLATQGHPERLWTSPLAESPALLPLVLTGAALYGAAICATYELYHHLDLTDFEAPQDIEHAEASS